MFIFFREERQYFLCWIFLFPIANSLWLIHTPRYLMYLIFTDSTSWHLWTIQCRFHHSFLSKYRSWFIVWTGFPRLFFSSNGRRCWFLLKIIPLRNIDIDAIGVEIFILSTLASRGKERPLFPVSKFVCDVVWKSWNDQCPSCCVCARICLLPKKIKMFRYGFLAWCIRISGSITFLLSNLLI